MRLFLPNDLYVAWQDDVHRAWHTIARLRKAEFGYELEFTVGAKRLDDVSKRLFKLEPGNKYFFENLIPLFRNKIPSRSRPDFKRLSEWLAVPPDASEFELLSAFGLIPSSDSTLTYPAPRIEGRRYSLQFFIHGIRYRHQDAIAACEEVSVGQELLPLLDVQNKFDENAVALRLPHSDLLIGYAPSFYATDLRRLLANPSTASVAKISVVRNNRDSPIQLRLLCRFDCPIPDGFTSFDADSYRLLEPSDMLN
jgi:hypothetical protein